MRMIELVKEHGLSEEEVVTLRLSIREQLPLGLHWVGSTLWTPSHTPSQTPYHTHHHTFATVSCP